MKKLLLLLLFTTMSSCESRPKPCNPECWKITELHISEETGYLNITHTNLCKKHLTYTNNVINNYHLYKLGDILYEENFSKEKKGIRTHLKKY
ncbi:hypothetical protein OAF18_01690 [Flavobacteriaceae bacterium]|jgi:hypothetical protein|nr:hypothetical protein [Flavobacteriaceae bacterium]